MVGKGFVSSFSNATAGDPAGPRLPLPLTWESDTSAAVDACAGNGKPRVPLSSTEKPASMAAPRDLSNQRGLRDPRLPRISAASIQITCTGEAGAAAVMGLLAIVFPRCSEEQPSLPPAPSSARGFHLSFACDWLIRDSGLAQDWSGAMSFTLRAVARGETGRDPGG